MKHICLTCISDHILRGMLPTGPVPCDYCEGGSPSALLSEVAKRCDVVLDDHYWTTHNDDAVVHFNRPPVGMDLLQTLQELRFLSGVTDTSRALEDLAEELGALWRSGGGRCSTSDPADMDHPYFQRRSDLGWEVSGQWKKMQTLLQHESRYFNVEVTKMLHRVFGDIHTDRTTRVEPVVRVAGPGTDLVHLIRARPFEDEALLEAALRHPERQLGTIAPGHARAGRMNSRGQSAFYGASAVELAIAEVRPPVGAKVATARFELVRNVRLLDLRRLGQVQVDPAASLFGSDALVQAHRRDFLRTLSTELTMPVMPDQQDKSYLVTQVVADYLANHERGPIDGIVYPSAQGPMGRDQGGFNVVLFPTSSRVAGSDGEATADVSLWASDPDDRGTHFSPEIWVHGANAPKRQGSPTSVSAESAWPITLRLNLASIEVHEVKGVAYTTSAHRLQVHVPAAGAPLGGRTA